MISSAGGPPASALPLPSRRLIARMVMNGSKAGFETALTINRSDYGLVWNRAVDGGGVLVGEEVEISINIEANLQVPKPATN